MQAAYGLADDGAARLVVAAEHRGAVCAYTVTLDDGLDAATGDDRVHVRAHHDGLGSGERARKARDDVAGVAADLRACVVNLHFRAHLLAECTDALGHVALLARDGINLYEFEQKVLDALLINHSASDGVYELED